MCIKKHLEKELNLNKKIIVKFPFCKETFQGWFLNTCIHTNLRVSKYCFFSFCETGTLSALVISDLTYY